MVVKIESFEGVTTTPNSPNYEHEDNDFWHQPGYLDEYTFASGLKLLGPIPNRENGGVWTGDFSQGTADDWFNDTDDILNAGDVPDGNAYIGAYDDHGFILFGLGAAYTVSALVTGYDGAPNALVAYDENQKLITGASIKSVAVDDWGHNIIQVTSKKPIAYVVFAGDYIVVDRLQFDTSKPDVIKGDKDGGKVAFDWDDELNTENCAPQFADCDVLLQDCPEGEFCYDQGRPGCAPSHRPNTVMKPCERFNDCVPGLYCAPAIMAPGCTGDACCLPYCDQVNPDCSALPGSSCTPLNDGGTLDEPAVCMDPEGMVP